LEVSTYLLALAAGTTNWVVGLYAGGVEADIHVVRRELALTS
jgi:hypothetical protein